MMNIEVSRLREEELPAFREFCLINWGEPHPLIHDEKTFDYYYRRGQELNFIVARSEEGEILSAGGFIYADSEEAPDVFNSFLLSKKGGPLALSLKVLDEIRRITGCRTMSCNNIRPKVAGIYQFLGCETMWMDHYYRMNPLVEERKLSIWNDTPISPPVRSDDFFTPCGEEALAAFPFASYKDQKPFKDFEYVLWRYCQNPWLNYRILKFSDEGGDYALLIYRLIEWDGARVMRIVDYIGDRTKFGNVGLAVDSQMKEENAEFCDLYCTGMPRETVERAGFVLRMKECKDVVPNYLEPPLMENIDFMVQTSDRNGFCMFRADGDQDRKRIVFD